MINFLYYIIILFLCSVIPANAIDKSIHVEWGYTPPSAPAVTGFKLYQEGTFVCEIKDPTASTMDCIVSLLKEVTNFTLTASFSDNTESPHSAPFPFRYINTLQAPQNFSN